MQSAASARAIDLQHYHKSSREVVEQEDERIDLSNAGLAIEDALIITYIPEAFSAMERFRLSLSSLSSEISMLKRSVCEARCST